MKLILGIILTASVVIAAKPDESELYEKLENFDVNDIIGNVRLLKNFIKCYLGQAKCTPDGKDIISLIPEALQSVCGKCSEKQKVYVAKVINAVKQKLPADFEMIYNLNDPEKIRISEFEEFLQKYSV